VPAPPPGAIGGVRLAHGMIGQDQHLLDLHPVKTDVAQDKIVGAPQQTSERVALEAAAMQGSQRGRQAGDPGHAVNLGRDLTFDQRIASMAAIRFSDGCAMSLPLDSDLLRSFLAVAETGSMTSAAGRVGRTQSALSMQIRRLEEVLGQSLFDRLPRGVALTARGRQLIPYARQVARTLEEAGIALRETPLDGPIRIGICDEYGGSVLPRVLSRFAVRHPDVDVFVRLDYSAPQLKALEADEIDLAVVFEPADSSTGEVLCIDPTVWVTSRAHDIHLSRPLPIAVYRRSAWCQDHALRSLAQAGIPWRAAFDSDTSAGFRSAVSAGLAVVPLSRSTIPDGCRALGPEDGFPSIDASRVVLKRNPRGTNEVAEALVEALREAFRPIGLAAPSAA